MDASVAEMKVVQPVIMCEGAGWYGVTDGMMGTTAVLPLQSEDRVSPPWEQGGPALSGCCFSAQESQNFECKQGQPNLGAGWADSD